jgi:hypothetical protein
MKKITLVIQDEKGHAQFAAYSSRDHAERVAALARGAMRTVCIPLDLPLPSEGERLYRVILKYEDYSVLEAKVIPFLLPYISADDKMVDLRRRDGMIQCGTYVFATTQSTALEIAKERIVNYIRDNGLPPLALVWKKPKAYEVCKLCAPYSWMIVYNDEGDSIDKSCENGQCLASQKIPLEDIQKGDKLISRLLPIPARRLHLGETRMVEGESYHIVDLKPMSSRTETFLLKDKSG